MHSGNNEKYFKYVSFMLHQLKSFGINIFILTTGNIKIPENIVTQWHKINEMATCVNVDNLLPKLEMTDEINDHYSRMTFLKLFSPFHEIISKYDKVLYMDTDIRVINDFMDIFSIDMGEYMFGAVEDYNMSQNGSMRAHINTLKNNLGKFNIEYVNQKYYNCGLIMFNMSEIKKHILIYQNTIKNIVKLKYKYPSLFPYPDQDILNSVIKFYEFPIYFNVLRGFTRVSDMSETKLLHYISVKSDFDKIVSMELTKYE